MWETASIKPLEREVLSPEEVIRRKMELDKAYAETQVLRKKLEECNLAQEYGESYPINVAALDDHGLERVRDNVADLKADAETVMRLATKVADGLIAPWEEPGTVEFRWSVVVKDRDWKPADRALKLLVETMGLPGHDPRRPLAHFYNHYARFRACICDMARLQDRVVWRERGYADWQQADHEFHKKFINTVARDALADVRAAAHVVDRSVGWEELPK